MRFRKLIPPMSIIALAALFVAGGGCSRHGRKGNAAPVPGVSPLFGATFQRDEAAVRDLIEKRAKPNEKVASAVILYNAIRIMRPPLGELMDIEPAGLTQQVGEIARRVRGVADVEKVLARKSGAGYWVDMHVEVDGRMSVHDAHEVAHQVKDAVRNALPRVQDVLIHIEPAPPTDP